ncbi:MAG TPA: hypothetical protein DEQ77_10995 [Candidatus Omnitrophica bacterium]|nr:hypothetical protein [Candidatus Omnitrophota bacterium]
MKNYQQHAKNALTQQLFPKTARNVISAISPHLSKLYFLAFALLIILLVPLIALPLASAFLIISVVLYVASSKDMLPAIKKQGYLLLVLLFIVFVIISKKLIDYYISTAYIPVTALILLVAILYNDLRLSFVFCVLASCFAGIIANNSLDTCLIFLITGITTALLVRKIRSRIRILTAGLCAGLVQALLFGLMYHQTLPGIIVPNFFSGIICAIAVTGILPLIENWFGILTNISLLELSDFNHPLLRKMVLETPGTHLHSLIVGNLAEAAAESIGANSLLARIGAYYHDIGKLSNPEYFVENQKASSKHSHLSPSMSKMVIMNHIKEGIELAKKYRLKPAIIDFISQHHGTSLVYYFYRKAIEAGEGLEEIQEEGFRYPGPRPTSKETAIVLLADSAEAACRGLTEPQPAKIEEMVHKVINNKFIDGQLNDCELTLKDLERIAKVFIHILSGFYHGRIEYPELSKKENHHKKHG